MPSLTLSLLSIFTLFGAQQTSPEETKAPEDPVRVEISWTEAQLLERLGERHRHHEFQEDVLHLFYRDDGTRGPIDEVTLTGCLYPQKLERLEETSLWFGSFQVEGLAAADIGYGFDRQLNEESVEEKSPWFEERFRGPKASPWLESKAELEGTVIKRSYESGSLGATRELTIYLPPGHSEEEEYFALYAADGAGITPLAQLLEPLILDEVIDPVVIVGIHSSAGTLRHQEYIEPDKRDASSRFERHFRFVVREIIPWAESEFFLVPDRDFRAFWGNSNGADFAASLGRRRPDLFAHIFAFSPGVQRNSQPPEWDPNKPYPFFHLIAGTLEPGFWLSTEGLAKSLEQGEFGFSFETIVRGHDYQVWAQEMAQRAGAAFGL